MIFLFPTFPMRAQEFDPGRMPGFSEILERWTLRAAKVVPADSGSEPDLPGAVRKAAEQVTLQAHDTCITESLAMADWLAATMGPCSHSAGYSMGLFAAVAHSGAIGFEAVLLLSRAICTAAHESSGEGPWATGAVIDFPLASLRQLMAHEPTELEVTDLYGAHSVLFTGLRDAVTRVLDAALAEGAGSTRLVPITAPFHTTRLLAIERTIADALDRIDVRAPSWPILSSITQESLETAADVRAEICRNVSRPMNWHATMTSLLALDSGTVVECGASFSLADLARQVFPAHSTYREFRDFAVSA